LLGVGVAFKIYYIMAWREGQTNLLQSVRGAEELRATARTRKSGSMSVSL
jgi:hypothetical protein